MGEMRGCLKMRFFYLTMTNNSFVLKLLWQRICYVMHVNSRKRQKQETNINKFLIAKKQNKN